MRNKVKKMIYDIQQFDNITQFIAKFSVNYLYITNFNNFGYWNHDNFQA